MSQPDIPAFGDWETTGNTPYTQKFEDARKNRKTGIPSQPNEPERHPEPPRKSPLHQSAYKSDPRDQSLKNSNARHTRRPETDQRRLSEHPAHRETVPRKHTNTQRDQGGNASTPRSPYRASTGPASPMQQNNQARPKHRPAGMHTPERRVSSEGHSQRTPEWSRMKPTGRGYEHVEEVAVPPFGDWDDANAESGEKYTGIFNKVRDNKLSPAPSIGQPSTAHNQENKVKQKCMCCIL